MKAATRSRAFWWGLVVAWLGVIWVFGESQALRQSPADPVLRWLARKGLHLVVYGVLGGLLVVALGPRRRWGWVLGFCLLVVLADEVHQGLGRCSPRGIRDSGGWSWWQGCLC